MPRDMTRFALVGLLALGACALPGNDPERQVEATPATTDAVDTVEKKPEPATLEQAVVAPPAQPTRPVTVLPLPPKPPVRPDFPRVHASELAGMTFADALSVFGKPASARQDNDTVAWTYENEGCRLTLVFYFSVARNALQAGDFEVGAGATPRSICLHVLAREPQRIAARPTS
ncbi:hypothetical protein DRB17_14795 [Ferruginivarius sediminum]|uniref:Outer membrane protein assembly factor BamE n=2 Tax=Ferruginivarius sediminum TaxID=2661937 RepID=A0A369TAF2_9PROT|nr:hypothetical protein DRB17_14795 [Ferruginivarius sediminum]